MKMNDKLTRAIGKAGLKLKKHSPEILAAVGTVGVVASAVMACKATTKISEILDDTNDQLNTIRGASTDPNLAERYSVDDAKKDTTIVYIQTGVKFAKLYGPAVAVGVASIGCLLGSNHILRKRNVALAAAYTAVDKSFKAYRGRVVERFGEDLDRELRYNIKAKEVQEIVTDENGNEIYLSQLNAGAKQTVMQVLLKVLYELGDYDPPVMIDTVMGVLDKESREVIINRYFPDLAHQTILLSTDTEITTETDFKKIVAYVARTYTLHRDQESQCTTVSDDYFGLQTYEF